VALSPLRFVGPAAALALFAAARSEVAVAALPVLALLRGPLGPALLVLAGVVALASALASGLRPRLARVPPGVLFAAAALAYCGAGLHYAERLQAAGDEPHYLLMAQSLWNEGDLDLADNYARGDYLEYNPGPLRPHYGAPRADGRPFPVHSPGLPLLLAPVYALAGRQGCILVLALLAAALTVEVWRVAEALTGDPEAALVGWSAAFGAPIAFFSFHIYTEIPSALALLLALRLLLIGAGSRAHALAAALLAACLPWLHVKLIPAAAALGVIGLVRLRGAPRWCFAAAAGVAALIWAGWYQRVFGHPTPLASYGGLPPGLASSPLRAAVGLLLDRSFGLLPHAPVFLLAAGGIAAWRRSAGRSETWPWALVAVTVLAPVLLWRMWWGGYCPPGRFLVPLAPLLAVAVAWRVASGRHGLARWRWALVAVGLALAVYAVQRPVDRLLLDRRARPTRLWSWLSERPGQDPGLGRYLPSLVGGGAAEWRLAGLWLLGLGGLLALDRRARAGGRADAAFSGLELPLVLVLAGSLAADALRPPEPGSVGDGQAPAVRVAGGVGVAGGERDFQHLLDRRDEVDLDVRPDVVRDVFLDRLVVATGHDHFLEPHAVGGEHLLLDAADRQDAPRQRDLAGHRHPRPHQAAREQGDDGGGEGDPSRGAVLGDRSLGNVEVDVDALEERVLDPQLAGVSPDP
jgi:hypothetical protein